MPRGRPCVTMMLLELAVRSKTWTRRLLLSATQTSSLPMTMRLLGNWKSSGALLGLVDDARGADRLHELAVGVEVRAAVAVEDLGHVQRAVWGERDATGAHWTPPVSKSGSCALGQLGIEVAEVLARRARDVDRARAAVGDVDVAVLGVLCDVERRRPSPMRRTTAL